jgi:6-phosphogluconolactonase
MKRDLRIVADPAALAAEAAALIEDAARRAVADHGSFSLVLAGGATPRPTYEMLAARLDSQTFPWSVTQVFFSDERCVAPDHEASNFRMASQALLDIAPVPRQAIHRIQGEMAPKKAASAYEEEIRVVFVDRPPRFDLVLLGMGEDGHAASLFPNAKALAERKRLAVGVTAPVQPKRRVTLTLPAINAARGILILVAGEKKAMAFERVMREQTGDINLPQLPAAMVRPSEGRLIWLADEAAARLYRERNA